MREGYCSCRVCLSVCPSVTTLAASASVHTPGTNDTRGFLLGFFLDFDSWIFEKNLTFKSYGVKKPICK